MIKLAIFLLAIVFQTLLPCVELHAESNKISSRQVDIIIYGATPAGISAAISAAKEKKTVLIINPYQTIGGMITNGLGASDVCQARVIGGFSKHYFELAGQHYQKPLSWNLEPKIALRIFRQLIRDYQLEILSERRIESLVINNKKIVELVDQLKNRYKAKIFIDASYEGDLMALAKVDYAVGRESKLEFNEPSAGVFHFKVRDQFSVPVPSRDKNGTLFPLVQAMPVSELGSGDKKIMAYNFRPCITRIAENRREFPAPPNYDASQFALLSEYLKLKPTARWDEFLRPLGIPGNKFDLNNRGPVSTDYIGANYNYPEASITERQKIDLEHKNYTLGLLYFLSNDPSVPSSIRDQVKNFGLCKDEFTDTDNFPLQLYVREARRLRGVYVMTQGDLTHKARKEDVIAIASCPIESHHVQRVETPEGVKLEGWVSEKITPYHIPYRSTLPKKEQLTNLLVAVTISATHIANSSLRMEPTYMIIGESLGVAASIAIESKRGLHDIDIKQLTKKLLERGQTLTVPDKALKYALTAINLDKRMHDKMKKKEHTTSD